MTTGHAQYSTGPTDADPSVAGAAHEGSSPQEVTYQESLLEGADPDEGFYE